ncbi:hypothetical protein SAY86_020471 [Trapa natans]|uniref:Late embryogenesis abundant protein LEA-2 subgroup domain-containing protein n=1 Tax=Trapa natans TaxID=22666 RepID=A0AAN7R484_TRANT|nr:hypothetical protein SAY86_020471 [Trapa natans]
MANATRPQGHRPPPAQGDGGLVRFLKLALVVLLTVIIILGLVVLIAWLVIRPKHVTFSVEDVYVHNYNLTHDHLDATFDLTLAINNRNRHVSFYYDFAELSVKYEDNTLAVDTIPPFHQGHRNVTRLYVKREAKGVALRQPVSRNLRLERTSGTVVLDVTVRSRVRYKVGAWKSRDRTVGIYCSPVLGHFNRSKNFEGTKCSIEIK